MKRLLSSLAHPLRRLSKRFSRKGLYPFLHRELATIGSGQRALSVGASGEINDLLLDYAAATGFSVEQVDIDPEKKPDTLADICEWHASPPVDVVVFAEVLEHVKSPQRAIDNVRRSMVPGGRLVLTVPFIFPLHDEPHDYYRFTRYGLEWLLRDFSEVRIQERNSWIEAIAVLLMRTVKSDNLALRALSPVAILLVTAVYPVLWLLGRWLPSPMLTTGYNVRAILKGP